MVNRASLVAAIRKATRLSYRDAVQCVDVLVDTLFDSLSRGEHIELRGLGSFSVRKIAARKMVLNLPESTIVPPHGKVMFRPCQKLREAVWNKVPVL